jgi:hypothetical protein
VDAVSTDEQIGADLGSIGKLRRDSLWGTLCVQEPLAGLKGDPAPDGFVTQSSGQFSPFNGQPARIDAQITQTPTRSTVQLHVCHPKAMRQSGLKGIECAQRIDTVPGYHEKRAAIASELLLRFNNRCLDPDALEGQGGCRTSYATSNDERLLPLGCDHVLSPG